MKDSWIKRGPLEPSSLMGVPRNHVRADGGRFASRRANRAPDPVADCSRGECRSQDDRGRPPRPAYVRKYGKGNVSQSDILDIDASNAAATVIADLAQADAVPSDTYDCIVLTQVLQLVLRVPAAISICTASSSLAGRFSSPFRESVTSSTRVSGPAGAGPTRITRSGVCWRRASLQTRSTPRSTGTS